eukprot:c50038_g1_i1 orf=222-443(-)
MTLLVAERRRRFTFQLKVRFRATSWEPTTPPSHRSEILELGLKLILLLVRYRFSAKQVRRNVDEQASDIFQDP